MGARSTRKGKAWERQCARIFTEAGIPTERCLTEARDGNVGDLEFPTGLPLTAQCRVGARPSVWRALKDAEAAAGPDTLPVALVRRNGAGSRPSEDVAVLRLPDLVGLVAELVERGWPS